MLAESDINQTNLCEYVRNGELDKLKIICAHLDENGKNVKYNLDIAGCYPDKLKCWDDKPNFAIRWACYTNKIKIVKYLMENWSHLVDITAENNWAISSACHFGYIEVVKYLCEYHDNKINITALSNEAFILACYYDCLEIVKYLCSKYLHIILNVYLPQYYINKAFKLLLNHDVIYYELVEHIDWVTYNKNIDKIITLSKNKIGDYFIFTRNLMEKKYKDGVDDKMKDKKNIKFEQIEKLIEIKYQVIQFFPNAPPAELNGQLSKNYEEGLELIYQLNK